METKTTQHKCSCCRTCTALISLAMGPLWASLPQAFQSSVMVLPTCLCPKCGQNTGKHVVVHYVRVQVRKTSRILTLQQSEDFGKVSEAFLALQNKCQHHGSPGVSKPRWSCIPPWTCTQIQEFSDSTVFSLDGLSKQHVVGLHEGW